RVLASVAGGAWSDKGPTRLPRRSPPQRALELLVGLVGSREIRVADEEIPAVLSMFMPWRIVTSATHAAGICGKFSTVRNADIARQIPLSEATAILVAWTEA